MEIVPRIVAEELKPELEVVIIQHRLMMVNNVQDHRVVTKTVTHIRVVSLFRNLFLHMNMS